MKRVFLAALAAMSVGAVADERPPNIVFVLADDLGWHQLGCYGSSYYETPVLDDLARQGMRFTDAYAAAAICSPTRASIMTGKYPARLHLTDYLNSGKPGKDQPKAWGDRRLKFPVRNETARGSFIVPAWATHLPLEEVTIAEQLKAAGYATGHFGKWHLNFNKVYRPGRPGDPGSQGFDEVLTTHKAGVGPRSPLPNDPVHVRQITKRTIEFIEANKERPFFAYVAHNSIHRPEEADQSLIDRFVKKPGAGSVEPNVYDHNNPRQAAMLWELDESIGRILAKLKESGLEEDTIFVFASDNGHLGSKDNQPLRGSKADQYEGGIRVPLIVRWPGKTPAGSICSTPVISNDFFPTFNEIAGDGALPTDIDGVSLVSLLKDPTATLDRDALYFHYPHPHHLGLGPMGAVRQGDFKLVEFTQRLVNGQPGAYELYDLSADLAERNNLAHSRPNLLEKLKGKLTAWRKEVGAQMIRKNDQTDSTRQSVKRKSVNLLVNPGFELVKQEKLAKISGKDVLGWNVKFERAGKADYFLEKRNPHSGNHAIKVVVTSPGDGKRAPAQGDVRINLLNEHRPKIGKGQTLTMSVWARADANHSPATPRRMEIMLVPSGGMKKIAETFELTREWRRYEIESPVPVFGDERTIKDFYLHFGYGLGSFWVDDVALEVSGGKVAPPKKVAVPQGSKAPVVETGENMLYNPGFEEMFEPIEHEFLGKTIAGWNVKFEHAGKARFFVDRDQPHGGKQAIRIEVSSPGKKGRNPQGDVKLNGENAYRPAVKKGKRYRVGIWAKADKAHTEADPRRFEINVIVSKDLPGWRKTYELTDEWKFYELEGTSRASRVLREFYVHFAYDIGAYWIDDVSMVEIK